jgi:hypothetical protein
MNAPTPAPTSTPTAGGNAPAAPSAAPKPGAGSAAPAPAAGKSTAPAAPGKTGAPAGAPAPTGDPLKDAAAKAEAKYRTADGRFRLQDGERVEEVDEAELVKRAQKAWAAERRFQEAHRTRQQVEYLLKTLKDPRQLWQALKHLGHEPRQVAEQYLLEQIEEESLTPEQKKVRDAERIIQERETEKQQAEQRQKQERHTKLMGQYSEEYSGQIVKALETSGLPKSPETVKKMAEYMLIGLERGVRLAPEEVVPMVRNYFMRQINELLGQTEGDTLLQLLGDGVQQKFQAAMLARVRPSGQPVGANDQPPPNPDNADHDKPRLSMDEWRRRNEAIKAGKA